MQNHKNLAVYREAYELSKELYKETEGIKGHFRLKEQLFGSSTSVPANLAEMAAMDNKNQQAQKIRICIGECNETDFWLEFCKDCGLVEPNKHTYYFNKLNKIRMRLFNLLKAIKVPDVN